MARVLWLGDCRRSRHQLSIAFGVDDYRFFTTYWYNDCDLYALEERYGREFLENIYFHIAAFEANKAVSLMPEAIALGSYERFHTAEFEQVWLAIYQGVWAQWRYENDQPHYRPKFQYPPVAPSIAPSVAPQSTVTNADGIAALAFCGGGKDSLLALNLLQRADIPYASLTYSSSIYGTAAAQHALSDRLLDCCSPRTRHRQYIYEDLMDSPIVALDGRDLGISTLTAAETPSSLFGALPIVLQHGYRYMVLAHERSANTGNLMWQKTGEEINHQWGKSHAAEQLLNGYIQQALIPNLSYFSILQPIYDVAIFAGLQELHHAIPFTHSCNIQKPWCKRCPKCAYVWLNYMAYLPTELVWEVFGENLLDLEENQVHFQQMLGLAAHTPFECIGQIDEARLAFELCRRKGLRGKAMDMFDREVPPMDWLAVAQRYLTPDLARSSLPEEYKERLRPLFEGMQARAMAWLSDRFSDRP